LTYFPDLSPYEYWDLPEPDGLRVLNVGWLDAERPFPRSRPSEALLERLWRHCAIGVMQSRGLHTCELCGSSASNVVERDGARWRLGDAELRIFGDRVVYACPQLLFHYVETHHYAPPDAFLGALETSPAPPEPAYFERLERLGAPWSELTAITQPSMVFRAEATPRGVRRRYLSATGAPFQTCVLDLVRATAIPRLLGAGPAIVLERLHREDRAVSWYRCDGASALDEIADRLRPGALVSFYFDGRVRHVRGGSSVASEVEGVLARHGEAVVGTLAADGIEITASTVASVEALTAWIAGASGDDVFYGAVPGRDDDGVTAITLALPDSDGAILPLPY
jgi:hypothetical protein